MTMTTHDAQVARYSQEYEAPQTTTTTEEPPNDSEYAELVRELIVRQRELAEARAHLDRLTEKNLAAVQAALSGTT